MRTLVILSNLIMFPAAFFLADVVYMLAHYNSDPGIYGYIFSGIIFAFLAIGPVFNILNAFISDASDPPKNRSIFFRFFIILGNIMLFAVGIATLIALVGIIPVITAVLSMRYIAQLDGPLEEDNRTLGG